MISHNLSRGRVSASLVANADGPFGRKKKGRLSWELAIELSDPPEIGEVGDGSFHCGLDDKVSLWAPGGVHEHSAFYCGAMSADLGYTDEDGYEEIDEEEALRRAEVVISAFSDWLCVAALDDSELRGRLVEMGTERVQTAMALCQERGAHARTVSKLAGLEAELMETKGALIRALDAGLRGPETPEGEAEDHGQG